MSVEMWIGLGEILDAFAEDTAVRVVVLTGAGNKAFVSGADISQFDKLRANADAQQEYDRLTGVGRAQVRGVPQADDRAHPRLLPGRRAGDRHADRSAHRRRGQPSSASRRRGCRIAYGFEVVRKLVALVGPAHARMILYTGSRIDAAEAERIGLINRMVADEDLNDAVLDLARTIADNAPLSVRAAKLAVAETDPAATEAAIAACFDSEDYREGRTAFAEKRTPRFRGR